MNHKLISGGYEIVTFKMLKYGDIFRLESDIFVKYSAHNAVNLMSNNIQLFNEKDYVDKLEGSILLYQ